MFNPELNRAVQDFTVLVLPLSEKDLEREWKWRDHDKEGIRFAFFVTLQELRELSVTLSTLRSQPTPAQLILGHYHAAYMDLQAAVFGLSAEDAEQAPAEGEWNIRKTYSHILRADIAFTAIIRYALERHRAGAWKQDQISDEDEARLSGISGMTEEEYQALIKGPLEYMLAYHRDFHPRIVDEFSNITNGELDLPSTFWEGTRFPIRHRLHRYEAHFVQHTVQVDKTLTAIGRAPNESQRLIRKIHGALAEAEGMLIGAEKMDETAILATVSSITEHTREIENILK